MPLTIVRPRTVLIGGGGDGLAAARLLRYPGIERIVLCDYDAAVLELATKQPDLAALNERALENPRLHVVCDDIAARLEHTDERFDLIVLDLPDGLTPELGRLYTVELFTKARARLAPGGLLVTQTCMAGCAPAIIGNTLSRVFQHVQLYRSHMAGGRVAGFTLASDVPLRRVHDVPAWTRYVTRDLVDAFFALGKDELQPSDAVNTLADPALHREIGSRDLVRRLSHPYVYNRDYRWFSVGPGQGLPDRYLEPLLEALEARGSVIVYVDARRPDVSRKLAERGYVHTKRYAYVEMTFDAHAEAALASAERSLPSGLIGRIEAWRGPADGHPDVLRLVEDYVDIAAERAFDSVVAYDVTAMDALYLVARAPAGEAVALWKVNDAQDPPDTEFFYGVGPHERNVAALIGFLRYVQAHVGASITGLVPVPRLVDLLISVGLRLRRHIDVHRLENLGMESEATAAPDG